MGKASILYDDRVRSAILSGAAPAGGLPLAHLQDPQPRKVTRWIGTSGFVVADFGASVPVGLVALTGTNLTAAATRRVRLSSVDATGAAGDVHDSGVAAAGADPRHNGAVFYPLAADLSARYLRVDLADASLSFLDVGLLLAGPAFRPARNMSFGWSVGWQEYGTNEPSPVGVRFTARRGRCRALALRFDFATESEAMGHHMEMARIAGATENVAVLPIADGAYLAQQAVVGLVQDVTEVQNRFFNIWSKTITIAERM